MFGPLKELIRASGISLSEGDALPLADHQAVRDYLFHNGMPADADGELVYTLRNTLGGDAFSINESASLFGDVGAEAQADTSTVNASAAQETANAEKASAEAQLVADAAAAQQAADAAAAQTAMDDASTAPAADDAGTKSAPSATGE